MPGMHWIFAKAGESNRQRESAAEKFFDSDAGSNRAEDLVREGLQNSMDAKRKDSKQVQVRIRFATLSAERASRYLEGLEPHIPKLIRHRPGLRALKGSCRYLAFEDFGTTGLTGDPTQPRIYDDQENHFHTFFRAENKTDKIQGELGSHGIGKVAFLAASQAHMVLGLTHRYDDKETLFLGSTVLRSHELKGQDYECDAWFGLPGPKVVMPSSDAADIDRFRRDFQLTRKPAEPGFSIVVPWLEDADADDDRNSALSVEQIIDAVLRGHAISILDGSLAVEITDSTRTTTIDRSTFFSVLMASRDVALKAEFEPVARLVEWSIGNPTLIELPEPSSPSPKWDAVSLDAKTQEKLRDRFEAGEKLAFKVPITVRGDRNEKSHFCVYLQHPGLQSAAAAPVSHFIRRKLLIAGMKQTLVTVRGLVVVTEDPINEFLRLCENVTHNRWDAKPAKERYTYAPATLRFVEGSIRGIVRLLAGDPREKDKRLWADDLNIPAGEISGGGGRGGKTGGKEKKPDTTKEDVIIEPQPKRPYRITGIDGGFSVGPSRIAFKKLPVTLNLDLGYHVRGANPLHHWKEEDFDLTDKKKKSDFKILNTGCSITKRDGNVLRLRIVKPDFQFMITGFDVNRDLYCEPRLEESAAQAPLEDDDAD